MTEDYEEPLRDTTTSTIDESITSRSRDNSISSILDLTHLSTLSEAERNVLLPPSPLYKIVLTGGPCGGKTTALARLSSYLRERGFEVLTCPEAYTILASNGMSVSYYETEGMPNVIQNTVMDVQMNLEDGLERVLRARGKPAVLLCDRGLMDGSAYMTSEEWRDLLQKRKVENVCELREGRYNAVFHVVTAAEGAEQYYTLENNDARTETPEVARVLDEKTRKAWVGHPNLRVFDNSTNFEGKLRRLVEATAKLVGLPSKLSRVTTKFLLRSAPDFNRLVEEGVEYHVFDVEKVYLYDVNPRGKSFHNWHHTPNDNTTEEGDEAKQQITAYDEEYSFVRKRTQLEIDPKTHKTTIGGSAYGQTTVKRTHINTDEKQQVIEVKRIITKREYNAACKTRDESRHIVKQKRISFLWKMQSFTVHMYEEPVKDLCILHAQVEIPEDQHQQVSGSGDVGAGKRCGLMNAVDLPPFLDIERPLRDTKEDKERFGAFNISLRKGASMK